MDAPQNLRALKIAIIIMTTLLILGFIALIYGVARTAGNLSDQQEKQERDIAARTDASGVVEASIPAGAVIVSTTLSNQRALIHFRLNGVDYLLTIDSKTGERKGFVRLVPE